MSESSAAPEAAEASPTHHVRLIQGHSKQVQLFIDGKHIDWTIVGASLTLGHDAHMLNLQIPVGAFHIDMLEVGVDSEDVCVLCGMGNNAKARVQRFLEDNIEALQENDCEYCCVKCCQGYQTDDVEMSPADLPRCPTCQGSVINPVEALRRLQDK